jgi:uncharacterized repeat protein (TIGR01451 family)
LGLAGWLAAAPSGASTVEPTTLGSAKTKLAEISAKMPLRFEENVGQVKAPGERYFARGKGYRLSLGSDGAEIRLRNLDGAKAEGTVRMRLEGGALHPALAGIEPLLTKSNYLLGSDPRAWHVGVASFGGVLYEGVYPDTDLVYSGNERRVEQTYTLAAGAEPTRIRMVYEGVTAAQVGWLGELTLRTPGGDLVADRPIAFQTLGGERREIPCGYEISAFEKGAARVGFVLGDYDHGLPLVIDPVFSNSTFLGGAGGDAGSSVGLDGDGNVYVAGISEDFPGAGTQAGGGDGFVAKIDPTGTTLLYATYFGGSDLDSITDLAVDADGNAYLTGFTYSTDLPGVTGSSLQSSNAGGPGDAFVAKIDPTGTAIVYATYLGGTGIDVGYRIAVDGSGDAYVTGYTGSAVFPGVTAGSIQPSFGGGSFADAFVTKIDDTGSAIVYSTYLGGSGDDIGTDIVIDGGGNAVVVGQTDSTNFPLSAGALEPASLGNGDAFAAKIDAAGTALTYSTYLGGEAYDVAQGVAVDASGNAYITGFTLSTAFTGVTAGSFQPDNPGGYAAYLTQIDAAGSAVAFSTFLGGGDTFGISVALDASANIYVAGRDQGGSLPIVNAASLQPEEAGSADGFVAKFLASGASLVYSTYFGGQDYDGAGAIAVDPATGSAFVTGQTFSSSMFGTSASSIQQTSGGGSDDAFLVRIVPAAILSIEKSADVSLVAPGDKITYTLAYENVGELAAVGATLTETVPANTVFKPAQSTAGWSCTPDDQAGSTCTLALGTVASGAGGSATFTVKLKNKVDANGGEIHNTACAHPGDNCSTVDKPTTAAPVFTLTKTPRFSTARPNNSLRYTLKASNAGNQDADPVILTDTVPPNATFDPTNSTSGWSCDPNNSAGSVCTFAVGTLAAGTHVSVDFAVIIAPIYSNTACVAVQLPSPELAGQKGARTASATPAATVCATATTPLQ